MSAIGWVSGVMLGIAALLAGLGVMGAVGGFVSAAMAALTIAAIWVLAIRLQSLGDIETR